MMFTSRAANNVQCVCSGSPPKKKNNNNFNSTNLSRVTFIVEPSCHPLLLFKRIELNISIFVLWSFLSNPHGVVSRDVVVLFGAFEESTLRRGDLKKYSVLFQ